MRIWVLISIIALLTTSCKKDSKEKSNNSSEDQNAVLVISSPSQLYANNLSTVTYTITSRDHKKIKVEKADLVLNLTGSATCAQEATTTDTDTVTVNLTSCIGDGTVGISISKTSSESEKQIKIIAGPSEIFTVDNASPTLAIGSPSKSQVSVLDTIDFVVDFTGADTVTLADSDISLFTTGSANCNKSVSGTNVTARTVSLSSCTGDGTVGISIAAGTASDLAGNFAAGAGPSVIFKVDNCIPAPEQIYFASQMSLNGTFNVPSPGNTWNIWSATSDGKVLKPVTVFTRGQTSRIPKVSIDGRFLFFYTMANLLGADSTDLSLSANVWMMDRRHDGELMALTQNSKILSSDSYSGVRLNKTSKIFFDSFMNVSGNWDGTPALSTNIFILDEEGKNPRAITGNTKAGYNSGIYVMSPASEKILAFSQNDLNGTSDGQATLSLNLWLFSADGKEKLPLTKNTKTGLHTRGADFFPDGTKIAFLSQTSLTGTWDSPAAPQLNIWTINADGTGLKNLTAYKKANFQSVAVSPDGKRIIARSTMALDGTDNALPVTNIWIMDSDGSNKTPITRDTKTGFSSLAPRFSPDGKRISFFSNTDLSGNWNGIKSGSFNLWLANVDGTGLTPITQNSNAAIDVNVSTQHDWAAAGANCK